MSDYKTIVADLEAKAKAEGAEYSAANDRYMAAVKLQANAKDATQAAYKAMIKVIESEDMFLAEGLKFAAAHEHQETCGLLVTKLLGERNDIAKSHTALKTLHDLTIMRRFAASLLAAGLDPALMLTGVETFSERDPYGTKAK
jgi:hypothetical protein